MKSLSTILISLASIIGLASCSGSSNHSTPVSSPTSTSGAGHQTTPTPTPNATESTTSAGSSSSTANKVETPTANTNSQTNTESTAETSDVTPTKSQEWRQFNHFVQSNETAPNNPLAQDGKISVVKGIAAYNNGDTSYVNNGKSYDLKNDLATTQFDPHFLNKGEINADRLQSYTLTDKAGNVLGKFDFINQTYSSYASWEAKAKMQFGEDVNKGVMVAYVADPTPANKALLNEKQSATYSGHTIFDGKTANLTLNADFNAMKISGLITGRSDSFLDNRAKFATESVTGLEYTTDPDEVDEGYVEYITPEKMQQRLETYSHKDITIAPTDIRIENGVVGFSSNDDALQYQADNGKTASFGQFGGIFAGPKASEVVGEIKNSDNLISFGATEVKK